MSEFCFYRRKLLKSVGSAARGHVNIFSISGVTDDNIKSTLFLPQKFQILPWNYTCDIFLMIFQVNRRLGQIIYLWDFTAHCLLDRFS